MNYKTLFLFLMLCFVGNLNAAVHFYKTEKGNSCVTRANGSSDIKVDWSSPDGEKQTVHFREFIDVKRPYFQMDFYINGVKDNSKLKDMKGPCYIGTSTHAQKCMLFYFMMKSSMLSDCVAGN